MDHARLKEDEQAVVGDLGQVRRVTRHPEHGFDVGEVVLQSHGRTSWRDNAGKQRGLPRKRVRRAVVEVVPDTRWFRPEGLALSGSRPTGARLPHNPAAMRRVDDYRKNARDCRELASRMPAEVRDQLLEFARHWDGLADERERYLAHRGLSDEPDPTLDRRE